VMWYHMELCSVSVLFEIAGHCFSWEMFSMASLAPRQILLNRPEVLLPPPPHLPIRHT
jgi:hypothetical protein